MTRLSPLSVLAVIAALASAGVASAQPEAVDENAPWARDVSPERREQARRLLEEGNALFVQSRFPEALAKYEEAVAAWDHPAIRYNIARALIALDRPVEAYENVEKALAYGAAPLKEQVFAEAQNYERLLRRQIAEMEVRCEQAGVRISVDGQEFLTCPGARTVLLAPGSHQVVARRPGFLTMSRDVIVMPGPKASVDVRLLTLAEATRTERRWPVWKPWAMVGGSAAVAGLGVLLHLQAQSDLDQYGREVAILCGDRSCQPDQLPAATRDLETRAHVENTLAVGTLIAGGAGMAVGVALVILNRPRTVLPDQTAEPPTTQVVPQLTPQSVGVTIVQRF